MNHIVHLRGGGLFASAYDGGGAKPGGGGVFGPALLIL